MMVTVKELIALAATQDEKRVANLEECTSLVNKTDYLLDNEDSSKLAIVLTSSDSNAKHVLQLIADIAKLEPNRKLLTVKELISKIIDYVISDDPATCVQSLRCLANISADNDGACQLFSVCNGVENVVKKAEAVLKHGDDSWHQVIVPACACIKNIIINSDMLKDKFLDNKALSILWKYVEIFHISSPSIASAAISGIAALADSDNGFQHLSESNILQDLLVILLNGKDEVIKDIFSEMLTEYGGKENARMELCRRGYVGKFCALVENRKNFNEVSCTDEVMKEMADLVVMMSSGEESFSVLQEKEENFLSQIATWITSPNVHIQVSAGLALGNYARSEETCNAIVRRKIHENLINVMKEHIDDEEYYDRFQSYASCLRNLAIPVENKSVLVDAGLHLLAAELVKKPSLGVQFKGLGIIRLLVQGNGQITNELMSDEVFMSKVCELTEISCVTSVPSEAQRLMAALLKYNNSEKTIRAAISLGGFKCVLPLLSSEHMLMQNEGLIAFIIAMSCVHDCLPNLIELEALPKVFKLLKLVNVENQTIFNCLTFVQAVASLDGGISFLKSHEIVDILENIKEHREDIIRNKIVETIGLIN